MTDPKALAALIEKVEAGEAVRSWDFHAMSDSSVDWANARKSHDGSLDAAKALHEAVLPGWSYEARRSGFGNGQAMVWNPLRSPGHGNDIRADHDNCPARAWLLAILRALQAKEGEG
jgi:hypothetical protein